MTLRLLTDIVLADGTTLQAGAIGTLVGVVEDDVYGPDAVVDFGTTKLRLPVADVEPVR